jgi:putative hydrolase of the HAD superfamily
VIFDRDGVLSYFDLDAAAAFFRPLIPLSLDRLVARWSAWQQRTGFPRDVEAERLVWSGFWTGLADEFELPGEHRRRLHTFDYTSVIRPFPEARTVLTAVRARGVRCAVLSNFSLASIDASLAAAGLGDLVDLACAGPVVGAMKPDAAAYRIVMDTLQVEPAECLLFDDEPANVVGARALGIRAYRLDRSQAADTLEVGTVRDLASCITLLDAEG